MKKNKLTELKTSAYINKTTLLKYLCETKLFTDQQAYNVAAIPYTFQNYIPLDSLKDIFSESDINYFTTKFRLIYSTL